MVLVYRVAKLQVNRNKIGKSQKSIYFYWKTKIFKIHNQQKLLTNRVDGLSCNYLEN